MIFQLHLKLLMTVLVFLSKESSSLKSMIIRVPEVVKSGDTVTLSCEYDLEHVALYSIKWYWRNREFYRFVPKESPPFRAFSMQHVNIDTSHSGPTTVTLRGVRRELSGEYQCEVTADGPLFHTDLKSANMIVVELPNGNPTINTEVSKAEIGKKIKAECNSPGSDPAANLTWYINDAKIEDFPESIKMYPPLVQVDNLLGLQSSSSKIEITTNRSFFVAGNLTLRCDASLYNLWRQSAIDTIRDDSPQLAPVLGSMSSQSQGDQMIANSAATITCVNDLKLLFLIPLILNFR